ncbi:DUF6069 family protein [Haloarchaeobius sp. HRN-SO-5]|uniref:DUF6069 family protein n=1 Tax=Haloarchaeobius sp. HRN-SO-5 TaxID=3446118 RepID=UPI003EBF01D7
MSHDTTTLDSLRRPVAGYGLPVRALVALAAAVVGNVAVVTAADAAGIAPDLTALDYPPVLFLTTVGVVAATGVYWVIARRVDDPTRTFTRVAALALVLSFLPDVGLLLGDPAATVSGVATLAFMHVVAAVACVAFLPTGE